MVNFHLQIPLLFPQRQVSMTTQMVRHHGRSVHKRSTIEILIRGKTSSSAGGGGDTPQGCYSHPHRFEKYNYTTPSYCDHCSSLLWGPLKVRRFGIVVVIICFPFQCQLFLLHLLLTFNSHFLTDNSSVNSFFPFTPLLSHSLSSFCSRFFLKLRRRKECVYVHA